MRVLSVLMPFLAVCLAVACAGGGTSGDGSGAADPLPGRYRGSGDDGFVISFTVDEAGAGITEIVSQVTCGALGRNETIGFTPVLPIENGRFRIDEPPSGGFGVSGGFVGDGSSATGDWSTGSCSGGWEANFVPGSAPALAEPGEDAEDATADQSEASVDQQPSPEDATADEPPAAVDEPSFEDPLVFVDEFDGSLGDGWLWRNENPDGWSLTAEPGWLQVTAMDAAENILVRDPPAGSYEIETAVRFGPTSNFQFAGLAIGPDGPVASFMQLGRAYCAGTPACIGDGVYLDHIEEGALLPTTPHAVGDSEVVYLRVVVEGDLHSSFYSTDARSWTLIDSRIRDFGPARKIGLIAHQAVEEPAIAQFDYFKVTSLESMPSDGASAETTPGVIAGTDARITVGAHEIAVATIGFDTTMRGMEPENLTFEDVVMFVEIDLLGGDRDSFEELEPVVTDGADLRSEPIALLSGDSIEMLATLTQTSQRGSYSTDPDNVAWAFVVARDAEGLQLSFPSGEVIDLTPVFDAALASEAVAFCELSREITQGTEEADRSTLDLRAEYWQGQAALYGELAAAAPPDIRSDAEVVHEFWIDFVDLLSRYDWDLPTVINDDQASVAFDVLIADAGSALDALDSYTLSTCGLT